MCIAPLSAYFFPTNGRGEKREIKIQFMHLRARSLSLNPHLTQKFHSATCAVDKTLFRAQFNIPDVFIEDIKFVVLQASPFEHIYHCCLNTAKKKWDSITTINNTCQDDLAHGAIWTSSQEPSGYNGVGRLIALKYFHFFSPGNHHSCLPMSLTGDRAEQM